MTAPIVFTVKRYKCPHCPRARAKKSAAVAHINRCWDNPDNRACRTCANYEPAESGGCFGDPQCNCPDTPQNCNAGVELPDFGGDMVTGCPSWKARDDQWTAVLLAEPQMPPVPPLGPFPGTPGGPGPNIQQATCPTCLGPVDGLLAGCDRPLCRTAAHDYDAALERLLDS